jgi:CheY-like chemotaxis protein
MINREKLSETNKSILARTDILLIENNESDAVLIQMALEYLDIKPTVYLVDDPEEAIDYLFAQGKYSYRNPKMVPKLIISELKFMKTSGFDVLERVKSNPATRGIPFTVFSYFDMESIIQKAYNMGANFYLNKPLGFDDLVSVLGGMINFCVPLPGSSNRFLYAG